MVEERTNLFDVGSVRVDYGGEELEHVTVESSGGGGGADESWSHLCTAALFSAVNEGNCGLSCVSQKLFVFTDSKL